MRDPAKLGRIGRALCAQLEQIDSSRDGNSWLTTAGKQVFFGKTAAWAVAMRPCLLVEWQGFDTETEVQPRAEGTAEFRITVATADAADPEQEMLDALADVLRVVWFAGRLDDLVFQVWPVSASGGTEFFQRTGQGEASLVVHVLFGYEAGNP